MSKNRLRVIGWNSELAIEHVFNHFSQFPGLDYELVSLMIEKSEATKGHPWQKDSSSSLFQALVLGKADLVLYPAGELPYPLPGVLRLNALLDSPVTESNGKSEHKAFLAVITLQSRTDLQGVFSSMDVRGSYGRVHLIGFGPGDPELLTIRGERLLAEADVILHDDLIDQPFLQKYRAEKVYVGKRRHQHSFEQHQINQLMLDAARRGNKVVRLKGGDPMVFAHGGEEVEFLQRNFVEVTVVPGVSAAMAMAAYAKIPLTHRDISSSIAFITGHSQQTQLPAADTLVIYMGGTNISKIARQAIEEGRDPDTPVLVAYHVSMPDQKEYFYTLQELVHENTAFPTPVIILVGEVVALRKQASEQIQKLLSLSIF